MKLSALILLTSSFTVIAANVPRQASLGPSITIQNGTIVGHNKGRIDSFRGIPYAQPPTGDLRLKPPQAITASFGTLQLPTQEKACPQQKLTPSDTTGLNHDATDFVTRTFSSPNSTVISEDCLTMNVQRPAGISADAKLPVIFWIFGGAFEIGSTQSYDSTLLLNKSMDLGKPVIYVAVNYRVSAFGFLAGKELSLDGSTNLGLRDQRLALEWVAENIAAFGGDPDKVTLWGESAGSMSVMDHLFINSGDHYYKGKPLFHGAVMSSGSILPALAVDSPKPQAIYDTVVEGARCSNADSTLECLRSLPYDQFLEAMNSQPDFRSYRSLDLSFLPRPDPACNFFSTSPDESLMENAFAKVPVIIGNQEDEGTLFALSLRNITTPNDTVKYLASYFHNTSEDLVADLVGTYSNDPAAGSPFNTGNANQLFPEFKRLAAIQGDLLFTLTRRVTLDRLSTVLPAWSYLATYNHQLPVLGTTHISDISEEYSLQPNTQVGATLQSYYINFVNHLDPNGLENSTSQFWPRYEISGRTLVNISASDVSLIKDDFRQTSYDFIKQHTVDLRL